MDDTLDRLVNVRRLVTFQFSLLLPQIGLKNDLSWIPQATDAELLRLHQIGRSLLERGGALTARLDELQQIADLMAACRRRQNEHASAGNE